MSTKNKKAVTKKKTAKKIKKGKAFRGPVIPKGFVAMTAILEDGKPSGTIFVDKKVFDLINSDECFTLKGFESDNISISIEDIFEGRFAEPITADPNQQELPLET